MHTRVPNTLALPPLLFKFTFSRLQLQTRDENIVSSVNKSNKLSYLFYLPKWKCQQKCVYRHHVQESTGECGRCILESKKEEVLRECYSEKHQ